MAWHQKVIEWHSDIPSEVNGVGDGDVLGDGDWLSAAKHKKRMGTMCKTVIFQQHSGIPCSLATASLHMH